MLLRHTLLAAVVLCRRHANAFRLDVVYGKAMSSNTALLCSLHIGKCAPITKVRQFRIFDGNRRAMSPTAGQAT